MFRLLPTFYSGEFPLPRFLRVDLCCLEYVPHRNEF